VKLRLIACAAKEGPADRGLENASTHGRWMGGGFAWFFSEF